MKGWWIVALVTAAAVAGAGVAADRIGPAAPAPAEAASITSSAWVCPHGGGPRWDGVISLANPGTEPVRARLTGLSAEPPEGPDVVTVEPGSVVLHPTSAAGRESATYVEVFDGWLATGWMVRAADPDTGLSVEPCTPEAGGNWFTTEPSTEDGEEAFLIVANPFAADAVFDVVLFSPDNPPLRDPDWSDLVLKAGRSVALPISRKVLGEEAVGATVQTKVGRVAVATLGVTEGGGVRGVLGTPVTRSQWHLPTRAGAGQSSVVSFVPSDRGVRFGARLLSQREPQAAGDLVDAQQQGATTRLAPVVTRGPSSVVVTTVAEGSIVAALRSQGQSADDAATGGTAVTVPAWVVLPTVADEPSSPGIVVENPGPAPVTVTLRLLPVDATGPTRETTFQLGPTATAGAPDGFFDGAPQAAVLVSASGPVVAAGASTSAGVRGISLYAIAIGLPVPGSVAMPSPTDAAAVP